MAANSASAAQAFKDAFVVAIVTAIADPTVLVTYGHPGMSKVDDMIGVFKVTSSQTQATVSPNRSREEILTLEIVVSCFRGGGQDQEQVAGDAAYTLLKKIEFYARQTDTTIGGTVRDCFLTSHEAEGATDPAFLAEGRCIEITATFTAHVRITGTSY